MPEVADYLQKDQPEGVPPLPLTGERTLPDVPEENYWFRRHLAVYEWIAARCGGLDVVDMACGEGYGTDVLARRAARVTGVDANPEAHAHAAAKYTAPGVRFERDLVDRYSRALRRGRLPPDDRARGGAGGGAPPLQGDGGRGLRLHAQRAHAGAGGGREVRQPVAPQGVPRTRSSRELCASVFDHVEMLGLFHARKLRAHELALNAGWDSVHPALGFTKPFYDRFTPAITARDFALRPGPLERALDFVAVLR